MKVDFATGTIQLPKFGPIRARFSRTFEGAIKTVTVSLSPYGQVLRLGAGRYGHPGSRLPAHRKAETAVGIDVGLKDFCHAQRQAKKIANPRFLRTSLKRLRRLSRQHSKKQKGRS